jgi:hypothetical protein
MVDTTQQYSADSQQKPQEEDILEASDSERNTAHDKRIALAKWEIAQANRIVGVSQNASSGGGVPPDAAFNIRNHEPNNELAETEDDIASVSTQETAKIRTPHPHDVFSGRGDIRGPIYQHRGNVQFRAWVSERRTLYLLAPLYEKRHIAREVVSLVQNQNPPGRFLKADPIHAGWWMEVDDGMVKTRLALHRRDATQTLAANEKTKRKSGKQEEFEQTEKRVRFDGNGEAEPSIERSVEDRVRQAINERADIASGRTKVRAKVRTPHRHAVLST